MMQLPLIRLVNGQVPKFSLAGDGCEYSSSCLTCPLPACKYDAPPDHHAVKKMRAVQLFKGGMAAAEVGELFGVKERTVWRWVERARETPPAFVLTARW